MTDDVPAPDEGDLFRLERGTSVERYVVLYELGSGGMGVVYAAYDPELDRKVALKLLHAEGRSDRARTRLLREAKAIARLTHPNVITVHDVGTFQGRVFVAMEYVDGQTLRQWLQSRKRSWQETLEVLLDAGAGLAAAHAADLIHRDFKPDNVLVDRNGRAVVLDFGLARRASTSVSGGDQEVAVSHSPAPERFDPMEAELTRTGAKLGTPAYMAPEQHLGAATDSRTDQFAFCVVLWEALYGVRPYRAKTSTATAMKVVKGDISEPPKHVTIPSRLRKVMMRGLSPSPDERYPTMNALLEVLRTDPSKRVRRWTFAGLGGVVVLGGGGLAIAAATAEPEICSADQGAQRWDGVWDEARREEVRDAFERTKVAYATTAFSSVEAVLDAYVERWTSVYKEVCEATHVRREQPEGTLALQMSCLRTRREDAASLIDEFGRAQEKLLQNAVEAASALPRVEPCVDVERQRLEPATSDDPMVRDRIETLRGQLAEARAKEFGARYQEALQITESVRKAAADFELPHIVAEASLRRANVLERRGDFRAAADSLLETIWLARAAGHVELEADAWIRLVWVAGVEQVDVDSGHLWARFAEATLAQLPRAELLRANLTHNLGGLHYRDGKLDLALEHYREALYEQKRLLGENDPAVAMTLNHIGNTLMERREFSNAREYCERSLELRQRILGRRHPKVAASLNNLSELFRKMEEPLRSYEYAEESLGIVSGTSGPEERIALILAASALEQLGRDHEAHEHRVRLATLEGRPPPAPPPPEPEPAG